MADNSIAKAYLQIVPSAKGMQGALGKIVDPEMPGAGQKAGGTFGSSLVGKLKGVIATAGIGAALGKAISAGADLQQSLGGIETLFKDSADTVIKNAERAYKTAGMSANQYMELTTSFSASLLQSLGGDTQKAATISDMAMTDMSDNANKMGTDMERITDAYQGFAKQNYTMLDNLKLGYGGTKTEMERLLADAQKLTGVKYDINNLSDVYEAIHVIQGELDITGTTAKEASSTISGSAASMKAAFSDLLANISLGRPIEDSLKVLSDSIFTFLGNLLPAVGNILSGLPAVLQSAFSAAIQGLNIAANNADALLQQGVDLVIGIGSAIIEALPYLAEAAFNLVSALGTAILTTDWVQLGIDTVTGIRNSLDLAAGEILGTDGNIIEAILTAIRTNLPNILTGGTEIIFNIVDGLLTALPNLVATGTDMMFQLLTTVMDALPEMLDGGIELIMNLVSGLWERLPDVLSTMTGILEDLLNTITDHLPDLLQKGIELVKHLANGLVENAPAAVQSITSVMGELLSTIVERFPDLLQKGIELIGEMATGLIQAIPDIVGKVPEIISSVKDAFMDYDWLGLGKNIIQGIIDGIGSMGGAIWTAAKNIGSSCLNSIKESLGIHSPSRVMRDQVGKWIPAGVATGIESNIKPLTNAMHELSDISTNAIPSIKRAPAPQRITATHHTGPAPVFQINIYGAPGQSEEQLAEIVMQKIQFEVTRREAGFA